MTRAELRAQLPYYQMMMERVTNKRIWNYYNSIYNDICSELHSKFMKDYPLNKTTKP